jgi:hypothetical protein
MSKKDTAIQKRKDDPMVIPYLKTDKRGDICHVTCKLCNAECREEAENYFDSTPNYRALVRWLKDNHDIEISYPAVRNHIIYHYQANQKYQYMEGYADDIKKWMQMPNERIPALKKRRAILEREMVGLGADIDGLKGEEKRKNIELMKKLADTLLVYDTKIDELYKRMEPVTMVLTQLNIIMTDVVNNSHEDETKEAFDEVLNKLESAIGDIIDSEE